MPVRIRPSACRERELDGRLCLIAFQYAPHGCAQAAAQQGSDNEEPELCTGLSAVEQCRADAACGVDRCPGDGNAHDVDEHQCKTDGQSGQIACAFLFVCGAQHDKHEDKGKYRLGQERLPRFARIERV